MLVEVMQMLIPFGEVQPGIRCQSVELAIQEFLGLSDFALLDQLIGNVGSQLSWSRLCGRHAGEVERFDLEVADPCWMVKEALKADPFIPWHWQDRLKMIGSATLVGILPLMLSSAVGLHVASVEQDTATLVTLIACPWFLKER